MQSTGAPNSFAVDSSSRRARRRPVIAVVRRHGTVRRSTMIPAGYMAKRVEPRPDWIKADAVVDIYSVSSCVSAHFADYINYWRHNGYWLFDSPQVISELADENSIDLKGTQLFYYEVYEREFNAGNGQWADFAADASFKTKVLIPEAKLLHGFDVVTFYARTSAECSPLSCNSLATEVATNQHCLLPSLDRAMGLLEEGKFDNTEPGPYRVFAVYSVEWPDQTAINRPFAMGDLCP